MLRLSAPPEDGLPPHFVLQPASGQGASFLKVPSPCVLGTLKTLSKALSGLNRLMLCSVGIFVLLFSLFILLPAINFGNSKGY